MRHFEEFCHPPIARWRLTDAFFSVVEHTYGDVIMSQCDACNHAVSDVSVSQYLSQWDVTDASAVYSANHMMSCDASAVYHTVIT